MYRYSNTRASAPMPKPRQELKALAARIRLVRTQLGYAPPNGNQGDFAKAIGATQPTVSDWEQALHRPSVGYLILMSRLCEDSDQVEHWLITGKGAPAIRRKRLG